MTSSSSTAVSPDSLKVLTLNVWGLAYISKARRFRIRHIADRIATGDWDVVALQELWVESEDWRQLKATCAQRFPYSKFFYSGAFGSGLAILSRFRIVETHTHPYSLNGIPLHVGKGDWFVGKAAGSATLDLGEGLLVDIFDTHTVATGGEHGPEEQRAHRIIQAWELSKLIRVSAERGRHVIALGDFNSTPPSLPISLLRHFGELSDAFLSTSPGLPQHATSLPDHDFSHGASPDPHRCISELGVTCDSPINTWTAGKTLDARAKAGAGKRLDYAFFRGPIGEGRLRPRHCQVVFTELIPGSAMSYSDHFGVEATFDIASATPERPMSAAAVPTAVTQKSLAVALTASKTALNAYLRVSRRTQRSHIFGFSACLTTALGLAVVTPFIGYRGYSFWASIAVILAVACGWGGTTLLYSAVVWGEWEKRAIRTVIESMELDLANLALCSVPRSTGPSRQIAHHLDAQSAAGRISHAGDPSNDGDDLAASVRSPIAGRGGVPSLI